VSAFSPLAAATEGWRVMRREPMAVLYWVCLWAAALSVAAATLPVQPRVTVHSAHPATIADLAHRFGPFAAAFIPILLLCWAVTTTATFRAVLAPEQRRWGYLRLGSDELRLAILTLTAAVLAPFVVSLVTYLLIAAAGPIMAAAPTLARDVAFVGTIATVLVANWIFVRLWLIFVETFDEGRFHLTAYWPLARGYFWPLFGSYVLVTLITFCVATALVLAALKLAELSETLAMLQGNGMVRSLSLWALLPVTAMLGGALPVLIVTLICACQAYAYRAITTPRTIH
jgi:hypothetical protein